jgi:hypothetical protein
MATEFICTIKTGGTPGTDCDYTTLQAWDTAMNAVGSSILTSAQLRVYSHSGVNEDMADNIAGVGTATGREYAFTVTHRSATQIMLYHTSASQQFHVGDLIQTEAGHNVTITGAADHGDTVIAVAELDGEVTDDVGINIGGWTVSATNYIKIRSKNAAKRSSGTALRYGSAPGRYKYTGSASPVILGENFISFEDVDLCHAGTGTSPVCSGTFTGSATSDINFNRCVIKNENSGSPLYNGIPNVVINATNCVFHSTGNAYCIASALVTNTTNLRFCTLYNAYTGNGGGLNVGAAQTVTASNCYANHTGTGIAAWRNASTGTLTLTTCASSDESGGTEALFNKTASTGADTYFTNLTATTEDFRLSSASSCFVGAGTDIPAIEVDIYTTDRPASPGIGAHEYVAANDTHTASGGVTLPVIAVGSGEAKRGVLTTTGAVSLGPIVVGDGVVRRVRTASGIVPLGGIDVGGIGHPTYRAEGGVTLGAVAVGGGLVNRRVNLSGGVTLGVVSVDGSSLGAPSALFCNNGETGAQSGDANPTGITDLTPNFSCKVSKLSSADITQVSIQVSAVDDDTFLETLSWDSGWLTLTTLISAVGTDGTARIEDITYGQGA